jgi:hypothetical protein
LRRPRRKISSEKRRRGRRLERIMYGREKQKRRDTAALCPFFFVIVSAFCISPDAE